MESRREIELESCTKEMDIKDGFYHINFVSMKLVKRKYYLENCGKKDFYHFTMHKKILLGT